MKLHDLVIDDPQRGVFRVHRYLYVLERAGDELKIRHKRIELDLEGLWDQGTVSILL